MDTIDQKFEIKDVLQSYVVKTNLRFNLDNLINGLNVPNENDSTDLLKYKSGTILSLKYKNVIKGIKACFKCERGFKNVCHLMVCFNINRKKKLINVKISSNGNFQFLITDLNNAEKIVYKIFTAFEKINKTLDLYTIVGKNRLELLIVPILKNCMVKLNLEKYNIFLNNSKGDKIQKFIKNNYLSFMVPHDSAIIIKDSYCFNEYKNHPLRYITYIDRGKNVTYVTYESYISLLTTKHQKQNAMKKKYVTLRLFSTGNILVSGFNEIVVKESIKNFYQYLKKFSVFDTL